MVQGSYHQLPRTDLPMARLKPMKNRPSSSLRTSEGAPAFILANHERLLLRNSISPTISVLSASGVMRPFRSTSAPYSKILFHSLCSVGTVPWTCKHTSEMEEEFF